MGPGPTDPAPRNASADASRIRRRCRAWLTLFAATLCAGAIAAAASAHHGEPATGSGTAGESDPGQIGASTNTGVSTDTDITPVAKPGDKAGWEQIAGSRWNEQGTLTDMASPNPGEPSPTPYDLDFYGVGFLNREVAQNAGLSAQAAQDAAAKNGFAVGAQCRRSDPATSAPPDEVAGCERIPVIYRFYDHPERGLVWEESYRASDVSDPGGYVAAVTWLGPDRALAVGGTGTYPRREAEREPGESDADYAERDETQGAGMARAWLFEPDEADPAREPRWHEITNLPAEMRALTVADTSPRPFDCGAGVTSECAVAGGMAQLWHFADGRFVQGYGPNLAGSGPLANAAEFRFRIRDLRFFPQHRTVFSQVEQLPAETPAQFRAVAVTSGCCSGQRADDRPAWLYLDAAGWHASLGGGGAEVGDCVTPPFSSNCVPFPDALNDAIGAGAGRTAGLFNPDSYYALNLSRNGPQYRISTLRTPGGFAERYSSGRESPSRFTPPGNLPDDGPICDDELCAAQRTLNPVGVSGAPAPGTTLSSLRLVSADRDTASGCFGENCKGPGSPDGVADWAVGSLGASGEGVAATTVVVEKRVAGQNDAQATYAPHPQRCEGEDVIELFQGQGGDAGRTCKPEAYQGQLRSRYIYGVGSYALNAFRATGVDLQSGLEGTGWAVGDHGAILRLGEGGLGSGEPLPARVGQRPHPAALPDKGAFDERVPEPTAEPGQVPPLAGRERHQRDEPGFFEGQVPDGAIGEQGAVPNMWMVMSRDGSEGWAFGPRAESFGVGGSTGIYHYDGGRWAPCDPAGVKELIAPDRACEAFASLDRQAEVTAAARIPLENDADPTNDDEFEAFALTRHPSMGNKSAVLRYQRGVWTIDKSAVVSGAGLKGDDVAFTAPDDGWVVDNEGINPTAYHYDGERWHNCGPFAPDRLVCADPAKRLAAPLEEIMPGGTSERNGRDLHLAVAGERIYVFGTRGIFAAGRPVTTESYPMIIYHDAGQPCKKADDPGCWRGGTDTTPDGAYSPTDGGWDPGNESFADARQPEQQGRVWDVAVTQGENGAYEGWASGLFGGLDSTAEAVMMRLEGGSWRPWTKADATDDYMRELRPNDGKFPMGRDHAPGPRSAVALPDGRAFLLGPIFLSHDSSHAPELVYDPGDERWEALPTPWAAQELAGLSSANGAVAAVAQDGQGGFWAAVKQDGGGTRQGSQLAFHHYTDRPRAPVFDDVPNPALDTEITALATGVDGTTWLGDANGRLYRYTRTAGWDGPIAVPNWDPRVSSRRSPIADLAAGPGGSGIAVGPGGRIAELAPSQVRLDAAATVACAGTPPTPPCGTGRDLRAAAVAPDGSALVGGEGRSLLWRPAGGEFRPTEAPPLPKASTFTRISMPRADRAYLLTGQSQLIAGQLSGATWSWGFELGDASPHQRPGHQYWHHQADPGPRCRDRCLGSRLRGRRPRSGPRANDQRRVATREEWRP